MAVVASARGVRGLFSKGLPALAVSALLAACGGGGGGSTTTPTPVTPTPTPTTGEFAVGAAMASIYQNGMPTQTLSSTLADNRVVQQVINLTPAADATYNGVTYHTAVKEVLSSVGGVEVLFEKRTLYFLSNPFSFGHAVVDELRANGQPVSTTGTTSAVSPNPNLALVNADVGDSGDFYSSVTNDSTGAVAAISSVRWELIADDNAGATGDSAYFCLNIQTTEYQSGVAQPPESGKDCYRITKAGAFLDQRVVINVGTETADLRP